MFEECLGTAPKLINIQISGWPHAIEKKILIAFSPVPVP